MKCVKNSETEGRVPLRRPMKVVVLKNILSKGLTHKLYIAIMLGELPEGDQG